MTIVDSSVWIALYNEEDSQHSNARKVGESFANVVLTEYIVLETSSLLLRKVGKDASDRFLEFALDNSEVKILHASPALFWQTVLLFRSVTNRKLSFVDTSLLYLSRSYTIITFDRDLEKEIRNYTR